jgi:hypothetical protein
VSTSFDRVRRRVDVATDARPVSPGADGATQADQAVVPDVIDLAGRAALYSAALPGPGFGRVAITCPGCATRSVVGYWDALLLALPSLHLPVVRGANSSWMRCPACRHRGWVAVALW